MRDKVCLALLLGIVGLACTHVPPYKRRGMFGLCQGWGAGCTMNYRSHSPSPQKSLAPPPADAARTVRYSVPTYLFTSGNSWNPIGKRSAWFPDIPYIRSPHVSLFRIKIPKGDLWRYPLVYHSSPPRQ